MKLIPGAAASVGSNRAAEAPTEEDNANVNLSDDDNMNHQYDVPEDEIVRSSKGASSFSIFHIVVPILVALVISFILRGFLGSLPVASVVDDGLKLIIEDTGSGNTTNSELQQQIKILAQKLHSLQEQHHKHSKFTSSIDSRVGSLEVNVNAEATEIKKDMVASKTTVHSIVVGKFGFLSNASSFMKTNLSIYRSCKTLRLG